MTKDHANHILNAAKDGQDMSQRSIRLALVETGDVPLLSLSCDEFIAYTGLDANVAEVVSHD